MPIDTAFASKFPRTSVLCTPDRGCDVALGLLRHPAAALTSRFAFVEFASETSCDLQVGEALHVELPQAGARSALVIRTKGKLSGREFSSSISKAAVSASLLLAPYESPVSAVPSPVKIVGDPWQRRQQGQSSEPP